MSAKQRLIDYLYQIKVSVDVRNNIATLVAEAIKEAANSAYIQGARAELDTSGSHAERKRALYSPEAEAICSPEGENITAAAETTQ